MDSADPPQVVLTIPLWILEAEEEEAEDDEDGEEEDDEDEEEEGEESVIEPTPNPPPGVTVRDVELFKKVQQTTAEVKSSFIV